jgi:AcrR family transcriptional regulator
MSIKERSAPQEHGDQAHSSKPQRKLDERARRTRQRLGTALIDLIIEKPMAEITVQEVLDRASVGRSTFYLHFRDKNDLLLSQLEMFLEMMSTVLSVRKEESRRVAPVEEMFAHIGIENKLYRALKDGGILHDFFDLAQGYFTRGIAQRLRQIIGEAKLSPDMEARAAAIAGSLLALLRWWIDHGGKDSPTAMDELFHDLVWKGMR